MPGQCLALDKCLNLLWRSTEFREGLGTYAKIPLNRWIPQTFLLGQDAPPRIAFGFPCDAGEELSHTHFSHHRVFFTKVVLRIKHN